MSRNPVKIGYFRITDGHGECREVYRYERVLMNPVLREALRKETLAMNRLYCCCREGNEAPISILPDPLPEGGRMIDYRPEQHSEDCRNYLVHLLDQFEASFLRAIACPEEPLRLDFRLSDDTRKHVSVINDRTCSSGIFSLYGKRASLEQLLYVTNVRAFGGLMDNTRKLYREEDLFPDVFFSASDGTLISFPDGTQKRISRSDFYSQRLTPIDASGFCYGKVVKINLDQIPEKDEPDVRYYSRIWLQVRDLDGKTMTLAVNRNDFRNLYYQLPSRDSIYIFGKATHKQEAVFDKGANKLPTAPKAKPVTTLKHDIPKKDVSICRQYVLFNVNGSGMIVFNAKELENSERALSQKKKLYRSIMAGPSSMGVPTLYICRDMENDIPCAGAD